MNEYIVFDNVVKAYGSHKALNGLNLRLERGKVTALLGPNGAGKTTAVSLLVGLLRPSAGSVSVGGLAPGHRELREQIGAMLQDAPTPDGLTVRETLQLFRSYYRQPLALDRLLQIAGLEKEASKRATSLSGGQKRRLAFAAALAGDPQVIVLDEPTVGMDVDARIRFWDVVRTLANAGRTIVVTTHYLEEADAIADRIVVIAEGQLVADGTSEQLKSAMPLRKVSFKTAIQPKHETLLTLPGVEGVQISDGQVQLIVANSDLILPMLMQSPWLATDIQVQTASLESVFRQITQTNQKTDVRERT